MPITPDADKPIDLHTLDPRSHDDAFVAAVMTRVDALLPQQAPRIDLLWGIWSLSRPLLIAGSVIVLLLFAAQVWDLRTHSRGPSTVAESLGVPPEFFNRPPGGGGGR